MSSYQVSTNNVKVFPSVQREQVESRKLTEARIVGLINKLVNKSGFVVSVIDGAVTSGKFAINIHGYYFEITDISEIINMFTTATTIWAYIITKNLSENEDPDYEVLDSLDEDGEFKGICFTDTEPANQYKLLILSKENNNWVIPAESKLYFEGVAAYVDGGDVSETTNN